MNSQRRGVCHPVAELAKLSGSCAGSLAQRWCSRWMNDHAGNAMAGDTNTIAARPSVAFTQPIVLRERWAASWSTVNMTKMARAFAATVSAHGSRCSIAAQLEKAKTARAAKKRETVGHEILGTDPPGSGSPRVVAVPTRGGACTETDISGFARGGCPHMSCRRPAHRWVASSCSERSGPPLFGLEL